MVNQTCKGKEPETIFCTDLEAEKTTDLQVTLTKASQCFNFNVFEVWDYNVTRSPPPPCSIPADVNSSAWELQGHHIPISHIHHIKARAGPTTCPSTQPLREAGDPNIYGGLSSFSCRSHLLGKLCEKLRLTSATEFPHPKKPIASAS